jgi:4-hydroxybenzoate polyprenyltransferase
VFADLWRASRPFSWINTALPFLAVAWSVRQGINLPVLLGVIYFAASYNLLLYGINDLYDYESDRRNPRKGGSVEGGLVAPEKATPLWIAIGLTNVPLLIALPLLGGPTVAPALLVTVAVALAYSVPPVRTKVIPILDSVTSSLHFVLPAICGGLVAGSSLASLPWAILAAFFLWGVASQALGAIQDVRYDREAGIGSVATAFGERPTAVLSCLAYCLAAAIVGLEGGYGLAAAVILLPYPLLAFSVASNPGPLTARRAWKGFLGMNLLSGFLLTQILLRAWGADSLTVLQLLAWGSAVGALAVLGIVLLNQLSMRRPGAMGGAPPVSIIIPARDERDTIAACLLGVLNGGYPGPLEVIVVDDGSADGTAQIARRLLRPQDRLLQPPPAPSGWTGKCWAAQRGAETAEGEVLVFLDADTVLHPHALSALTAALDAQGGGLLSILTRYVMRSASEHVLMPAFAAVQLGFLPTFLMNAGLSVPPFAYGPCMVVRRNEYLAAGGHAALSSSDREDIDLARAVARAGFPVRFRRGADLARTRHYRSLPQIEGCWRRTYYAYGGHSLAVALVGMAGIAVVYLLPFVTLPLSLAAGDASAAAGSLLALAGLAVLRLLIAIRERQPLLTVLWHPLTWTGTLLFQALGVLDGIQGRKPRWRGRPLGVEVPA